MLLLSIHPRHVQSILAGAKQVELRRLKPSMASGTALIYATMPQMELVASFQIESVYRKPLDGLWRSVRNVAGVTRDEFDCYFDGLDAGVAIQIGTVTKFAKPVSLDKLRAAWAGFHPPQGFRYITDADLAKLDMPKLRTKSTSAAAA